MPYWKVALTRPRRPDKVPSFFLPASRSSAYSFLVVERQEPQVVIYEVAFSIPLAFLVFGGQDPDWNVLALMMRARFGLESSS